MDVSCGVPRSRRLKKKNRAVQSSRHFTPYFLRDCVVRAVKQPLPEDRHKLESRGIRKSHSRVGNRSVCERKSAPTFPSKDLFFFLFLRNVLKRFDIVRIFRHILSHIEIYMSRYDFSSLKEFETILGKPRNSATLRFPNATEGRGRADVFSLPVRENIKCRFSECESWRMRPATYLAAQNGNVVKAPARRGSSSSSSSSSRRRSTSPGIPCTVAALLARK